MSTRLDEIRARVEKATPGPWYPKATDDRMSMNCRFISTEPGDFEHDSGSIYDQDSDSVVAVTLLQSPGLVCPHQYDENTEFIAHAREDIPYLLDRVDQLEKEVLQLAKINEGRHYMLRHDGKWFAGEKTAINWLSSRLKALEPTE